MNIKKNKVTNSNFPPLPPYCACAKKKQDVRKKKREVARNEQKQLLIFGLDWIGLDLDPPTTPLLLARPRSSPAMSTTTGQLQAAPKSAVTLKGSAKMVAEFFHYGIHSILYQRGIYPPGKRKKEERVK